MHLIDKYKFFTSILALALLLFSTNLSADETQKKSNEVQTYSVLGDENAPITMKLFIVITCPHCGTFIEKDLPKIQKEFIDTGKAKMYIYHAPAEKLSFHVSSLLYCDDYPYSLDLTKILLIKQEEILNTTNFEVAINNINRYFKLAGYTDEKIKQCQNDFDFQQALNQAYFKNIKTYNLQSTPTLIINEEKYEGEFKFEAIKNKLDSLK